MSTSQRFPPVRELLDSWPRPQAALKEILLQLLQKAGSFSGLGLELVSRSGVSHSLRFSIARKRPVVFLIDLVDLGGGDLMLSVCFYQDEISDPQELGNAIPQGLFQETGYCFDVEQGDAALLPYLAARMDQAWQAAQAT